MENLKMLKNIHYVEASIETISATVEETGEMFVVNHLVTTEPYATWYTEITDLKHGEIGPVPVTTPVEPALIVPLSVSMRQARIALLREGWLDQVQPIISAMPSAVKEEAEINWEYSTSVARNSTLVKALSAALGLTDSQLDDLFILAATL